MRTSFATAERSSSSELEKQIRLITQHPVFDSMTCAFNGIFAVCNEFRQILSVNHELLELLGINDASQVLGLRPGEALSCIHAHRCEGGCGTSEYCSTCGAAIAMVSSLATDKPAEDICAISVNSIREKDDFFFKVKATPIKIESERFLILTMQNITQLQKLQALERVFLHDVANIASAISGLSEFATQCEPDDMPLLLRALGSTSTRLISEIRLQRMLATAISENYHLQEGLVSLREIFEESVDMISGHPSIAGRKLRKPEILPEKKFTTDKILLLKVLQNMLINAFEATDNGRAVRFWVDCGKADFTFCVWNHQAVAANMRGRIFQRNYTTKNEPGHGLGTYSMKIFGENLLKGRISYETSEANGTVFRFFLPVSEIVNS